MDIRVLGVTGSTRGGSGNTAALRTARLVAPSGVAVDLYEGLADLPAFSPDATGPNPAVDRLRAELASADAVLFCTPEYAGSMPGSLKNLLDWTVGTADLYEKPVAWFTVAAEGRGLGAEAQLATVLGYVGASVVEAACVRVPVARDSIGLDGTVADETVRDRFAEALAALAAAVRPAA
jgi:chromate reductase